MVITSWSAPARPLPGQLPEEILLATEKRVARAKDGNRSGVFCSVSLTLKQVHGFVGSSTIEKPKLSNGSDDEDLQVTNGHGFTHLF